MAIQVSDFGTDDTAVRAAFEAARAEVFPAVYFGPGVYTVDGSSESGRNGIAVDFSVTIEIHPDATIQQIATTRAQYCIFDMSGSTGVTIKGGGTIRGDYEDVGAGSTYEQGAGLVGAGFSRLTMQDITITNCRGDCIAFSQPAGGVNQSIRIERCTISRSTRNGMSIGGAHRLLVQDCAFEDNGLETMPMAHIDIEGHGGATDIAQDLWFSRNTFGYAPEQDLVLSSSVRRVRITDNRFTSHRRAVNISNYGLAADDVIFSGNDVRGGATTLRGFGINSPASTGVVIKDNVFTGIALVETTYGGAVFFSGSSTCPRITNNTFTDCYGSIRKYAHDDTEVVNPIITGNEYVNTPVSEL